MTVGEKQEYTGIDNLEVMREAVNYNRFLVDLVLARTEPGQRIVDFGAGAGTFALPVRAAGHAVACVEPDPTLADHLRKQGFDVHADLANVPDGSLDYLYSLNVLEHIGDDAAIVNLWFRKLRPGGRVLVYVPAFNLLFSTMDAKVGHHRRYRLGPLRRMLQGSGFQVASAAYVDSLGFLATLAYKLVGSKSGDINPRTIGLYDRYIFPVSRVLDLLFGFLGGKNLCVFARKPAPAK
jgi:SAM-dependent methyltransferase